MTKPTQEEIEKQIKELEIEHLVHTGIAIDDCNYDNCPTRKQREKLRKQIQGDKK